MEFSSNRNSILALKNNMEQVIIGKSEQITLLLTALLAKEHILLEDMPGTGKTMLAKSLAASIDASYKRVQFTPDLLPSDVTGLTIYQQKSQTFEFVPGPIFTNILLADEINRATPRTQSCLLEAMAEHQVTTDGVTRKLPEPFFLIATQNPIETAGTFPLPEAQLDRFALCLSLGFPSEEEELSILNRFTQDNPLDHLTPVCTLDDLNAASCETRTIFIHEDVKKYMVSIAQATRHNEQLAMGVTPRGTLSLMHLCQAYAYLQGRSFVLPEDVKYLATFCFSHRILSVHGSGARENAQAIMEDILSHIPVPTENFAR